MLKVLPFQASYATPLRALLVNTVRCVCQHDYSAAQIDAWAAPDYDHDAWLKRLTQNQPMVAVLTSNMASPEAVPDIVGFADVQADGYIDHFFCHADHQGSGIGRLLMLHIHELANQRGLTRLYSNVSITARPFFEHYGFSVVREQQVRVRSEILTNYLMQKSLR